MLLINLILVIGMTLCSVIIYLLLRKKRHSERILAIVFGFLLCSCLEAYSEINNILSLNAIVFPFVDLIGYAIGPLLYLYIVAMYRDCLLYTSPSPRD